MRKITKLTAREQGLITIIIVLIIIIAMLIFASTKYYKQLNFKPNLIAYQYYTRAIRTARCAVFEKQGVEQAILLKYDLGYLPISLESLALERTDGSLDERRSDSWIYRLVFNPEDVHLGGYEVEILVFDDILFVNGDAFGATENTPFHYYIAVFEEQFNKCYELNYGTGD